MAAVRKRVVPFTVVAAISVVASCGSDDAAVSSSTGSAPSIPTPSTVDVTAPAEPTTESAPSTAATVDPPETSAAAPETSAAAPESTTEATVPAPAWPDDGCSVDNSAGPVASADGPVPVVPVRDASADGPLPDLVVRRINCATGWENLRNEIPADRPLLVWFWAPH